MTWYIYDIDYEISKSQFSYIEILGSDGKWYKYDDYDNVKGNSCF